MTTSKADLIAALGGATTVLGTAKAFTADNSTNQLTVTGHGRETGDGPVHLTSSGQLPTGLAPQKAVNGLTFTAGAIADDVVEVNGVYYQFAADPTTGTPDGSVGTPYLVDVGLDDEGSLANLLKAINASGVGGTDYSAEIVAAHATVVALASTATTVSLRAILPGVAGNAYTLSVTGTDGIAADAAVFSGGLDPVDYYVKVIDDNKLQLSLTSGGAAVPFTDNGSGTQVIGATAQGVADALEAVLDGTLTRVGMRSGIPEVNKSKAYEALVRALI